MSAGPVEYTVVLRSRSGARVRPGFYLDLTDFPDGQGGLVQLRISTRWEDVGLEHPLPRELWFAVRSPAASIDAAMRSAVNAASAIAAIISFCSNAAVEPPELHLAFSMPGKLFPTLRWRSKIQSVGLTDGNFTSQPEETITVQFAPGLQFELRDYAIYGGLNPAPPDAGPGRPPGWGPDSSTAGRVTAAPFEIKKPDLLARVMPLVDATAASGADTGQAFPRPFAFKLFGQGVAYFQSAQLLITDSRPVEALPLMYGLVVIAARFEQMTSESLGIGLAVRLELDAQAEELPENNSGQIQTAAAEMLRSAAQAGLPIPDDAPPPESTAI